MDLQQSPTRPMWASFGTLEVSLEEKRVHQRARVEAEAQLDLGEGDLVTVTVSDISLGGVYVRTALSPRLGVGVTLRLDVGGRVLELPGTVRWTREDGIGLQFGLLGAKDTHALSGFLRQRRE